MTDSFNQVQMFLGLGYETSILEACNWDQDECNRVVALFSYEIFEALKDKNLTVESVNSKIRKELESSLEAEQVDVLMNVLKDACSHSL